MNKSDILGSRVEQPTRLSPDGRNCGLGILEGFKERV